MVEQLKWKYIKVNDIQEFEKLMKILEKISPEIRWKMGEAPTEYKVVDSYPFWIRIYSDLSLTWTDEKEHISCFHPITLEEIKQILPETSPSELEILQEMVDKLCTYVVDEHWPNFLTVEEAKGFIREEALKTLKGKRK